MKRSVTDMNYPYNPPFVAQNVGMKFGEGYGQVHRDKAMPIRRMQTSPHIGDTALVGWKKIRDQVSKKVLDELKFLYVDTRRMNDVRYRELLPGEGTTEVALHKWKKFLKNAMMVTDEEIGKHLLSITRQQKHFKPQDAPICYFRSWELDRSTITTILNKMTTGKNWGDEFELSRVWAATVQATPVNSTFTIRYVGQVCPPNTAYKRHEGDLKALKAGRIDNGIKSRFLSILESDFPHMAFPRIYTIDKTKCLPINKRHNIGISDDNEIWTIALFGVNTLLNRQNGGAYPNYNPPQGDYHLFRSLKTNFFDRFFKRSRFASTDGPMYVALKELFEDIQVYVNKNTRATNGHKYPYTNELRDVKMEQALPKLIHNTVIIEAGYTCITHAEYANERSFWDSGSRSVYLTGTMLSRLQAWELGQQPVPDAFKNKDPTSLSYFFPCHDLIPWLNHEHVNPGRAYFQQWLRITRPLILPTMGTLMSSIALSSFGIRPPGIIRTIRMLDVVGKPTICNFDGSKFKRSHIFNNTNDSIIIIPHFHPGHDRYIPDCPEFRRVINLTHFITILYASIAMDEVLNWDREWTSRYDLVRSIHLKAQEALKLVNWNRTWDGGPGIFPLAIEDLKKAREKVYKERLARKESANPVAKDVLDDTVELCSDDEFDEDVEELEAISPYEQHLRERLNREDTEDERKRCAMKFTSLVYDILEAGRAAGDPNSETRTEQVDKLWNRKLKNMHPHGDQFFELPWKKALNEAPKGSWFIGVIYALENYNKTGTGFEEIVDVFRGIRQKKREVYTTIWQEICCYIIVHSPKKDQFITWESDSRYIKAKDMQNSPVDRADFDDGTCHIRWMKSDGEPCDIWIHLPPSVSRQPCLDLKLIFNNNGISVIRMPENSLVRFQGLGWMGCTWSSVNFFSEDPNLVELWCEVLKRHPSTFIRSRGQRIFGPKGRGWAEMFDWAVAKKREPLRNDAVWPLLIYVERTFPSGGDFYSSGKFPHLPPHDDEFIWPQAGQIGGFIKLLKTEEFYWHPYAKEWLEVLGDPEEIDLDANSRRGQVLARMLQYLCNDQEFPANNVRTLTREYHWGARHLNCTIFRLKSGVHKCWKYKATQKFGELEEDEDSKMRD